MAFAKGQADDALIADVVELEQKVSNIIDDAKGQAYDIAICLEEGQMTEEEIAEAIECEIAIREHEHYIYLGQEEIADQEEIAEAIECEIAIREHEHYMYLDHMENVYGRNWRKLEAESERNFRKSLGLEEG